MNRTELENQGFNQWVPLIEAAELRTLPQLPGVYAVSYAEGYPASWPVTSCGGWHKGRNPAVDPERLRAKWVDGTDIVYVGMTDRTLAKRIREFARFGKGEPVGHWGGRLIWQLPDPGRLMVGWIALDAGLASWREREMLAEFIGTFGRLPFANLRM